MRVVEYKRVSTDLQHSSIENQSDICKQWIEKNNGQFIKSYEDEGISGANGVRVEWLQMIEDGKNGLYDCIVTKSFSRFGRNQTIALAAIKDLRAANIRVVFLDDNLDTTKDTSTFGLFAWLAEQEAHKTSERIKSVWDSYNSQGKVHVTLAPYGYIYNKDMKNFIVNEEEAEVVRDIFNMYLEGTGFNSIAQRLIDRSITTKRGGKWAGTTIRGILTNEFYIGTLIQGKTRTIDVTMKTNRKIERENWFKHLNNHKNIISKEVFEKVNRFIEERSNSSKLKYTKEHRNRSVNSNKSLFSNLLKCGHCNSAMTIKRKKREKYKPYYQCLEYDRLSLKCGHSSNRITEAILMEIVKEELQDLSKNNFNKLKNIQTIKRTESNNDNTIKRITGIDKKIGAQIQLANNLLMFYTQSKISEIQYQLQNDSIKKVLNSLMKQKNILENQLLESSKGEEEIIFTGIERVLNKPIEEWNNSEFKEFIEKITIFTDGRIVMKVKYFN